MIRAEAFPLKDDLRASPGVLFDATRWFEQATPKEIVSLGLSGSCGYSAQVVARWQAQQDDELAAIIQDDFDCLIYWENVIAWALGNDDPADHPDLADYMQDFGLMFTPDDIINEIRAFVVEFLCLVKVDELPDLPPLPPDVRPLPGCCYGYQGFYYCYRQLPDQTFDVCCVRTGLCVNMDLENAKIFAHVLAMKLKDVDDKNFLTFDFEADPKTLSVILDSLPVVKYRLAYQLPSFLCPGCNEKLQMPLSLKIGECSHCGKAMKVPDNIPLDDDAPLIVAEGVLPDDHPDYTPVFINNWLRSPDDLENAPHDE